MPRLHIRLGETSQGPNSYVPRKDFERSLEDQKRQRVLSLMLEKEYTDLAKFHRSLSEPHIKMKIRGKKRENFSTQM